MKKTLFFLGLILLAGLTNTFAGGTNSGTDRVIASFHKDFAHATTVSLQKEGDLAIVTFSMNNQVMYAYYKDETAELLAVARNILSDRLPIKLLTSLKDDYSGYWITSLAELAKDGMTTYFATLENADETIFLKSGDFNDWSIDKKLKKN